MTFIRARAKITFLFGAQIGVRFARALNRLLGSGPYRCHRFVDSKGNPPDIQSLSNAPRALAGALLNAWFGYRPELPWVSYRAVAEINKLLQKNWKIIEFGSGMSTLWFSKRCAYLHSIESDVGWYEQVRKKLTIRNHAHVKYELRKPAAYPMLSEYPDGFFDFGIVDGICRDTATKNLIPKIRSGGWLYLDNSDSDMQLPQGEMRIAEDLLKKAVHERNGAMTYFVDFAPTQFFVNQGVLARI